MTLNLVYFYAGFFFGVKVVNDLDEQRDGFFSMLHAMFIVKKGFGAFAFISSADANHLFDQYLSSGENQQSFINKFIMSIDNS